MEAKHLQAGYRLSKLCIDELAGNRGRNYCVHLIFLVALAVLYDINGVKYERLVRNCTKGTLVNTSAAGRAFIVVDRRRIIVIDGYCFYLTSVLTGTLMVYDSGERADLCTLTALNTL